MRDTTLSVKLSSIIEKLELETIVLPDLPENILLTCASVSVIYLANYISIKV